MQNLDIYLDEVTRGQHYEISIVDHGLVDECIPNIIDAVKQASSIVYAIDLTGNCITSHGVAQLCYKLFEDNTNIKEVNMTRNGITAPGAECVLRMLLESNHSIRSFQLAENTGIPQQLLADIKAAMSFNAEPFIVKKWLARQLVAKRRTTREDAQFGLKGEMDYVPPTDTQDPNLGNEGDDTVLDLADQHGKFSLLFLNEVLSVACPVLERVILRNCGLYDSGLKVLLPFLMKLEWCVELDLSGNGLTSHGCSLLASELMENKIIRRLDLSSNNLSNDALQSLIDTLWVNDALIDICVSDNKDVLETMEFKLKNTVNANLLPVELKRAMHAMLVDDPHVRDIELAWVPNMTKGGEVLGPLLPQSKHVTILNMSNAQLGDQGTAALAAGLKENAHLFRLELANNLLTNVGAIRIVEAIAFHPTLRELNLANNRFGNRVAEAVLQVLNVNDVLSTVNLEMNGIEVSFLNEIEGLCIVNRQPTRVRQVLVNMTTTLENDEKAKSKARRQKMLSTSAIEALFSPAVFDLNFSTLPPKDGDTYLTSESVMVLCRGLSQRSKFLGRHVKTLDFSHNPIGDLGVAHLVEWFSIDMAYPISLEEFKINDCGISDKLAVPLIQGMWKLEYLKTLELSQNPVTDTTGMAVYVLLEQTKSPLDNVVFKRTKICSEMKKRIETQIRINREPASLRNTLNAIASCKETKKRAGVIAKLSTFSEGTWLRANATAIVTDDTMELLFPAVLGSREVHSIVINDARIGFLSAKALRKILEHNDNHIQYLTIHDCQMFGDNCAIELAQGIKKNTVIEELHISNTAITDNGLLAIADALDDNNTMTVCEVDLKKNYSYNVLQTLDRALTLNSRMLELKPLLARVHSNDSSLSALKFHSASTDTRFDDFCASVVAENLRGNHSLIILDLSHNAITTATVENLVNVLEDNETLTTIDLSDNNLDDKAALLFTRLLGKNHFITCINLEKNVHVNARAIAEVNYMTSLNRQPRELKNIIAQLLNNDPHVQFLDFNGKNKNMRLFDDDSSQMLCSVLIENTAVKKIDLANNNITDIGAGFISDALLSNTGIRELYLENNYISTLGGSYLSHALDRKNVTLKTLRLEGNLVEPFMLETIASQLHVNMQKVRHIDPNHYSSKSRPRRSMLPDDNETIFRNTDYYQEMQDCIISDALVGYERHCRKSASQAAAAASKSAADEGKGRSK